jgi:hypothetical protein
MTDITPPVACTLDPADMPARAEEIRALGRDGLEAVERDELSVTLRFRPGWAIRERVERVVAAESRCCAFLDFTLVEREEATELTIAAEKGAEPAVHDLADLFAADAKLVR